MARQASKKLRAANAATLRVLLYGFLLTTLVHLVLVFYITPRRQRTAYAAHRLADALQDASTGDKHVHVGGLVISPLRPPLRGKLVKFLLSESVAVALGVALQRMASQGDDLAQAGLTAYMFDFVYITWFVHLASALVTEKAWYTYLVIPLYASYVVYTKLVVPFVLGGNDPLRSLSAPLHAVLGGGGGRGADDGKASAAAPVDAASGGGGGGGVSKRQAKMQKRAEKQQQQHVPPNRRA